MRRVIGENANPHNVLRTRIRLDQALFASDNDPVEIDINPSIETQVDDVDLWVEEFGWENVELAHHFLHRHRLYKMHVLKTSDLDTDDLVAFMLIEEEQGLRQAEQSAKLQDKTKT